jgi:hypothetical protein
VRDFTVVDAVTKSVAALLKTHFVLSGGQVSIVTEQPDEVPRDRQAVSLWLYRLARNPDVLNEPRERIGDGELARPHLPVDLHYLVTPRCTVTETIHRYLGRILQTFNDTPILRGAALAAPLDARDTVRITLESVSTEDLTRLWTALTEPYQVALCYCAQLVRVPSAHEPLATAPVKRREIQYEQIIEAGA